MRSFAVTLWAFAVTLFASALLLFLVQPMIGKTILPKLGGSPNVWSTCMVFFQIMLLLGYAYSHFSTKALGVRRQAMVHALLLLLPLVLLPLGRIAQDWDPPASANPFPWLYLWLLAYLALAVGLPFFMVSTSAPLLQKWFASTHHPSAKDPYFLYAASNLGSMLALIGYLVVVEPNLRLAEQRWAWMVGYGVLAVLTFACAVLMWTGSSAPAAAPAVAAKKKEKKSTAIKEVARGIQPGPAPAASPKASDAGGDVIAAPTWGRRLNWIMLAFIPSSAMLGVTTYMSTDLASSPLLWIIPLALYLLSFILVFSRLPPIVHKFMILVMPVIILLLLFMMLSRNFKPGDIRASIGLHLVGLFLVAMVCHGDLALKRPATAYLTEYYLLLSVGGVLGGIFNALLAPVIFNPALYRLDAEANGGILNVLGSLLVYQSVPEYALILVLACVFLPPLDPDKNSWLCNVLDYVVNRGRSDVPVSRRFIEGFLDFVSPLLMCLLVLLLVMLFTVFWSQNRAALLAVNKKLELLPDLAMFGLPLVLCYAFVERPLRFGLSVTAIMLVGAWNAGDPSEIYRERSFFGILKIETMMDDVEEEDGSTREIEFLRLIHGTTMHGEQAWRDGAKRQLPVDDPLRRTPLTYYHRMGPIGELMRSHSPEGFWPDRDRSLAWPSFWQPERPPFAVIGLGTGTMACYGQPGQELTFYEIDTAVTRISTGGKYFTYVPDAKARGVKVSVVDGDARLKIKEAPDGHFKIIIVDAFSSDAIPIHLITLEAVQLFRKKLRPDGVLAYHISNRHFDLEPVLAGIAHEEGMVGLLESGKGAGEVGRSSSTWVILAQPPNRDEWNDLLQKRDIRTLRRKYNWVQLVDWDICDAVSDAPWVERNDQVDPKIFDAYGIWRPLDRKPNFRIWTDDYSNILSVFTQ